MSNSEKTLYSFGIALEPRQFWSSPNELSGAFGVALTTLEKAVGARPKVPLNVPTLMPSHVRKHTFKRHDLCGNVDVVVFHEFLYHDVNAVDGPALHLVRLAGLLLLLAAHVHGGSVVMLGLRSSEDWEFFRGIFLSTLDEVQTTKSVCGQVFFVYSENHKMAARVLHYIAQSVGRSERWSYQPGRCTSLPMPCNLRDCCRYAGCYSGCRHSVVKCAVYQ